MTDIYLGRDNTAELTLLDNGVAITPNVATRAVLWLPAKAMADGVAAIADSDVSGISLNDDATAVLLSLGDFDLNEGIFMCKLTIFDAVNTDGIAWATIRLIVSDWPVTV